MQRKVAVQLRNSESWKEMARATAESGFEYVAMGFGDEKQLLQEEWKEHVCEM